MTPGAHQLYLSIFDAGDGILDSGAFVDRLQAGAADPPAPPAPTSRRSRSTTR